MPIAQWKVAKTLPTDYQQWINFPDTPDLTIDYPYQFAIHRSSGGSNLFVCESAMYVVGDNLLYAVDGSKGIRQYWRSGTGIWNFAGDGTPGVGLSLPLDIDIKEANADIYTSSLMATVWFAKTTTLTKLVRIG